MRRQPIPSVKLVHVSGPERFYAELRGRALAAVRDGWVDPSLRAGTLGAVIDIPSAGGFATIVALADDTTSVYTNTGGGTIGAGEHEAVAAATRHLLEVIDAHRELFAEPDNESLPRPGTIRFHGLDAGAGFTLDVPDDAFWGKEPHDLMPVITATQELIGALRSVGPQSTSS